MKKIIWVMLGITLAAFFMPSLAAAAAEKTITLDIKEMEIGDVVRMIADQSGLNIIISRNVRGQVTLNLQDVTIEKALESILKVNNYGYIKDGNIITVCTLAEMNQRDQFSQIFTRVFRLKYVKASDLKQMLVTLKSARGSIEIEPKTNSIMVTDARANHTAIEKAIKEMDRQLETRIYRLNYAKPQDLVKNLQAVVPDAEGDILSDERTNSVLVTAPPMLLKTVEMLIASWDRQIPQVLIEARIMEITLGNSRFLGVKWQAQDPATHGLKFGVNDLPLPTGASAAMEAFKIGVLDVDNFEVAVQALESTSDVNILSNPRIVTLDNTEAKILIGSSEPYEVFHYDSDGKVSDKEIKFMEVGIKLTVTPKISGDGYITMNIKPEVSSPRKGTVTDALAVDTTEASAMMTVKDGNTVVMGGLIKDDKEKHISKIPFLGDIPLLGLIFRNHQKSATKKEIIIFITPHIISGESSVNVFEAKRQEEMRKALIERPRESGKI